MSNYKYRATMWNFGHDMNGNPIAHYELREHGKVIASTNKRREQVGYGDNYAEAPISVLWGLTGKLYDAVNLTGSRSGDLVSVDLRLYKAEKRPSP